MVKKLKDITVAETYATCKKHDGYCDNCPFKIEENDEHYPDIINCIYLCDMDDVEEKHLELEINIEEDVELEIKHNEKTEEPKVIYLCNRQASCKGSPICGTECKHTHKVEHAVNFKSNDYGLTYEEIEPEPEELYPGKVLKHGKYTKKVTCYNCGCEFISEIDMVRSSLIVGVEDTYYTICPECRNSFKINEEE